jgi:hypothetical protein
MNEICRARRKLQRAAAPKERVGLQARMDNTRASQDQRRACSNWTIPKKKFAARSSAHRAQQRQKADPYRSAPSMLTI